MSPSTTPIGAHYLNLSDSSNATMVDSLCVNWPDNAIAPAVHCCSNARE